MNDSIKIQGFYRLVHKKSNGDVVSDETVKNIVTNVGKAQIALLAGDATAVPFTYIALGTSSASVSATDTALNAEIADTGLSRAAGTISRTTTSTTNDTYQATKVFTATGNKTVEEIGIFNDASAGTILSHALTGTKSLQNTDTLTVTYTLRFS